MQYRSPHRNLILEAEGGRASRGPLLDRHVAMLVGCAPRYELDQRLRLVGKAVRRDFDGAQQLITLEHGTVVISYVKSCCAPSKSRRTALPTRRRRWSSS